MPHGNPQLKQGIIDDLRTQLSEAQATITAQADQIESLKMDFGSLLGHHRAQMKDYEARLEAEKKELRALLQMWMDRDGYAPGKDVLTDRTSAALEDSQ